MAPNELDAAREAASVLLARCEATTAELATARAQRDDSRARGARCSEERESLLARRRELEEKLVGVERAVDVATKRLRAACSESEELEVKRRGEMERKWRGQWRGEIEVKRRLVVAASLVPRGSCVLRRSVVNVRDGTLSGLVSVAWCSLGSVGRVVRRARRQVETSERASAHSSERERESLRERVAALEALCDEVTRNCCDVISRCEIARNCSRLSDDPV